MYPTLPTKHTYNTPNRQCWKKTIIVTVLEKTKLFSWSVKLNSAIFVYSQQYILFSVLILHIIDASQVYVDPFVDPFVSYWRNTASFLFILCFCHDLLAFTSFSFTHVANKTDSRLRTRVRGRAMLRTKTHSNHKLWVLLVVHVVTFQLSHVSFKGWDILLGNGPLSTNLKDITWKALKKIVFKICCIQ